MGPCVASGKGRDYQVGPGKEFTSVESVPWASLAAGDTVRIFHRAEPYRGKILVAANGTASAPVRICGVKSASGERPILDGKNAVTTRGLNYGDSAGTGWVHQSRSVIQVKHLGNQGWKAYPTHIQIDGLEVRGAQPANTFTDADGVVRNYTEFGACVVVTRGHNITIADNVLHDCTQGIYTKSSDDGFTTKEEFALTKDIRILGNYIYDTGVVGSDRLHGSYTASVNLVMEYNHYGPQRQGALGNLIKDRSAGVVVRYNKLNGGARAVDLVEAEDFPLTATSLPSYREAFVYGNQITKVAGTGSTIHYGGDHSGSVPGANWGEEHFRRGTLYFFNNTVYLTGTGNYSKLFQLSTTLERAEVWNNVFYFAPGLSSPSMRADQEVNKTYWTSGGIVNLGRNWINANWADSDPYRVVSGQLLGQSNMITGTSAPINLTTLAPLAGSAVIGAATPVSALPSSVAAAISKHLVTHQLSSSLKPETRPGNGSPTDLGAIAK